MRLGRGSTDYVEDRRGQRVSGPMMGGGLGLGGLLLVLLISWFTGADPRALIGMLPESGGGSTAVETGAPITDDAGRFATDVLGDVQETWGRVLGGRYQPTTLVLFTEATQSGCGFAQAATGPFYCPADQKVYIDLSFYEELSRRFGAPGDFAQAYVLAHEVGHHVQNILGTERRFRQAQQQNPGQANELSVRMELQADCYAGIWGHSTEHRQLLDPGDVEEGLAAAAAIGDDRLQREAGRRVSPESFTHGTSAQRQQWLRRGMEQGSVEACDTFSAR